MTQLYYVVHHKKLSRHYHVNYNSARSFISGTKDVKKDAKIFWHRESNPTTLEINLKKKTITKPIPKPVQINFDGFKVDLNQMNIGESYQISYDGSVYEIMKNERGELVVNEIV